MELDTRQRAILAEMGIKVWAPPGAAILALMPTRYYGSGPQPREMRKGESTL